MVRKQLEVREKTADAAAWMKAAPARPMIDRSRLLQEAVALLDEGGLDGLTMRKLGERLGVQAASLYNHVRDKDQLVALLADALSAEIKLPDRGQPWRTQLEALAREFRRVLLAHRDAAIVFAASPPVGPNRMRTIECALSAVLEGGFAREDACKAAYALHTFVMGFALEESYGDRQKDHDPSGAPFASPEFMGSLSTERFPTMCALAQSWGDFDVNAAFEFSLAVMLSGFDAHQIGRAHV